MLSPSPHHASLIDFGFDDFKLFFEYVIFLLHFAEPIVAMVLESIHGLSYNIPFLN